MDTFRSEELIREFHQTLARSGMPAPAAARHRDRLRFFLHAYLAENWPRDVGRLNAEIVRDFLGSWFLRHVGGSKADLTSQLGTFRRFFDFLYDTCRLAEAEFEDLCAVSADRDYFHTRHEEFFRPTPDAWEDFILGKGKDGDQSLCGGHPVDRQLWVLTNNLEHQSAPAVLDFALFLDYLGGNPVKLVRAHRRFPLKDARRLNRRFSRPEVLTGRGPRMLRLGWFLELAVRLDLIRANAKAVLELTPRAEAYLDLDSDAQLTILIDATWNLVPWETLSSAGERKISQWAQEHRHGFAALLTDLVPGRAVPLDPDPMLDREDALLTRYVLFHDVVENSVIFGLGECGIMEYAQYKENAGGGLNLKSIAITRYGRQVMRLFARRWAKLPGMGRDVSPIDQLEENLLFS